MAEKSNIDEEYVISSDFEDSPTSSEQVKEKFIKFLESPWWITLVIILIAISTFSLGRYSSIQERREPLKVLSEGSHAAAVIGSASSEQARPLTPEHDNGGQVVASKNGSKYHYPWCGGAKQISEKNLISFNSIEEARKAGYTPASNCKGLK